MNQTSKKSGKLIVFEGLDGMGKSTQILKCSEFLNTQNIRHCITREPGGTDLGQQIRTILKTHDFKSLISELCLIFAARAEHLEKIIWPALAEQQIVLCDRFIDSTFAYQGGGQGISYDTISALEKIVLKNFEPDLVILLDAPIQLCLQRLEHRGKPADRIEQAGQASLDFFQRIRDSYIKRTLRNTRTIYNIVPVISEQNFEYSVDQIFEKIRKILHNFL